jgi:hypothetical protein
LTAEAWQRLSIKNKFLFRIEVCVGIVLIALSILINGYGATSHDALKWNVIPDNIDDNPFRVWDWKNPQFWPRDYKKKIENDLEEG